MRISALPERPARRAGLLIELGEAVLAFDADANEFVVMPGPGPDAAIRSLSFDGTRMLLVAERGVCVLTLRDGEQRWFDTADQLIDQDAALSPDGGTAAVLASDEEEAVIALLDPATGQRRELWRVPGAASWESGLRWSPDGRLIAATYMIWDDELDNDALSTVVVDAAGGGVRAGPLIRTHLLGGWLSDRLLPFREEYDDLHRLRRLDVTTGQTTAGPTITGRIWDAAQGRHIHEVSELEDHDAAATAFYTTDINGTDRRPLFTLHPKTSVRGFHLAAGVELRQSSAGHA